MIVESSENQTYYIPFDVFLNATRIVKLYVEVALGYDHYEKMLYSANGFIRDLKAYQSLLKELGISVKKQFTFHDNSIINTTNSLLNENKK
ncbi:MAG: hypothetical protein M0D57_00240 [Sphingobacteriales bacterium JAD_PAG50586_3]|nr:MAG: hypothetical protein M0D57_00240 [Sphingobacteriales bacterium JAD_PAG50586_3]